MSKRSAIIFLPDDTVKTGLSKPMMLQCVMGAPLLKWLCAALHESGVGRYFLLCGNPFLEEAEACFPQDVEVTTAQDENPSDLLHVFLSMADENEEDVLVVTGPIVYAPTRAVLDPGREPRRANACMVSKQELMQKLDGNFSFGRFLRERGDACTDREGFFTVGSVVELADWQAILGRIHLCQLAANGVEIWDYSNCYVEPGIDVGIGTVLLPGTILRGKTTVGYGCVIGPNTVILDSVVGNHTHIDASRLTACQVGNHVSIGPFANIRPGTVLENHVKAGAFVELKDAKLAEAAQVPHLSYLGDATVGKDANIGCGTVTANFDRVEKKQTIIEDNAFVGCNTCLIAPLNVGKGAYVAAGSTLTEDVPSQALGVARARQSNRKEWSLKNKEK